MAKSKNVVFRLSPAEKAALEELAQDRTESNLSNGIPKEISASDIIREALAEYLPRFGVEVSERRRHGRPRKQSA